MIFKIIFSSFLETSSHRTKFCRLYSLTKDYYIFANAVTILAQNQYAKIAYKHFDSGDCNLFYLAFHCKQKRFRR